MCAYCRHVNRRWLILADDVSGAADCAAAFAARGIETAVRWQAGADPVSQQNVAVIAYDACSRGLLPAAAGSSQRAALERFCGQNRTLYVKIDSRLRGQPAAQIAAALETLARRRGSASGVLAPAFPAMGTTTLNGRVCIDGLEADAIPGADLIEMLAAAGIAAERVELAAIRGNAELLRARFARLSRRQGHIAVCDALTDEDLARIARATLPARASSFFAGSAGFARALAAMRPAGSKRTLPVLPTERGALIVVGSLSKSSRAAARTLARQPGVRHISPTFAMLEQGAGESQFASRVIAGLETGEDVLVEIPQGTSAALTGTPQLAQRLAQALRPAAAYLSGLAATGGETAASLFAQFGIQGIRLVDEIEPGVPLGQTLGSMSVPVVTKAGAFGDPECLMRIVARLRDIRREGLLR